MSITKYIGWGSTALSVGMSLSLAACQSNAISPKLAPSEATPSQITEPAIEVPLSDLGPAEVNSPHLSGSQTAAIDPKTNPAATLAKAESDSPALGLANHLTEIGAQMFGAYWCPHCQEQKKKFGDAFSAVDYVECDPGGENPRTQHCLDNNIEAFPTWVINNEHHMGVHSLAELAALSGYEGEL